MLSKPLNLHPNPPVWGEGSGQSPVPTSVQTQLDTITQAISQLSSSVNNLSQTVSQQGQIVSQLSQGFNTLTQLVASMQGGSGSNGSSTPPAAPDSSTPPAAPAAPSSPAASADPASRPAFTADGHEIFYPDSRLGLDGSGRFYHYTKPTGNSNQMVDDINNAKKVGTRKLYTGVTIPVAKPFERDLPLDKVVTADLEALITKEGLNPIYMASWYRVFKGNPIFKVFDITQFGNNTQEMLKAFWLSLLQEAKGCSVYFHNWAGIDAILSMESLISLNSLGYSFNPVLQKGKLYV
jgi:hypothetical protein